MNIRRIPNRQVDCHDHEPVSERMWSDYIRLETAKRTFYDWCAIRLIPDDVDHLNNLSFTLLSRWTSRVGWKYGCNDWLCTKKNEGTIVSVPNFMNAYVYLHALENAGDLSFRDRSELDLS